MKALEISRRRLIQGGLGAFLLGGLSMRVNATSQSDTLIVYLSRTQNNKILAEFIAQITGGDLAALETAVPYPKNYQLMRDQVAQELSDGKLPVLKGNLNTDRYRRIIIAFPTWGMQLPPPVKTFLHTRNLKEKCVMPLNTHAGYGVGSGFKEIEQLALGADMRPGLSLEGGNERDGNPFVMQGETLRLAQTKIHTWLQK